MAFTYSPTYSLGTHLNKTNLTSPALFCFLDIVIVLHDFNV